MSHFVAKTNPPIRASAPTTLQNNTPSHADPARSFSPIRRESSRSFGSSIGSYSPQSAPSPRQSSFLNTSIDGSFTIEDTALTKICSFVSGVRQKAGSSVITSMVEYDHTAVLYDENMYLYGGVSSENSLLPTIYIFNFASRSFSSILPATGPAPRYQHTAVRCDNQMIVFGGGGESKLLNDLVVFSFDTQTWSEIVPVTDIRPLPRRGHSATLIGRNMYIFGGNGDSGPLNDVYKFNLDQKQWTLVKANGSPPQPRFLHTACTYKTSFCVFGGTSADLVFGDIFMFNCDSNTWSEITVIPSPMPSPRCSHTAVITSQDSMVIVGGATDSDALDAYEYFFEANKWMNIELTTAGVARQGHSAVLRGESIFLYGGNGEASHGQIDMLSLGNKDDFEDEYLQDEDIVRAQSLPRELWEATLLKKHPGVLQYHELTRSLTGVQSYARSRPCATTEDPAHLNHPLVLGLVVEYLHSQGYSRTANAIVEESKIPYFPISMQPHTDSRLVNILKVLKLRKKSKNIFDADFIVSNAHVPDTVDPELELVDHMSGRVEFQQDNEEDVDIWAEPEDSRKNIVRTQDNSGKLVIRAANLNKLVQVLTLDREKAPDAVFLKTFFYTYRSFTSPEMVLKKLIQKYNVRPEKGVVVDDELRTEVQKRVCRVLKFWIEQCPWDFNGSSSEKLLGNLNAFIDGPLSKDGNSTLVKQLRNSITKSMNKKSIVEGEKTITAGFSLPEPKVPRNIFSHTLSVKDIDELEIARQLTLIEFQVFSFVTPPEYLNKGWLDPNPKKSAHIKELKVRAQDTANWVALTIMKADTKKNRGKMLDKFVRVADQLRQIKNFQTAASITNGFCHPSIQRLGQTFAELPPRAREIHQESVIFVKDDKAYREIMRNPPLPCIPNMDIVLADIAHLQDTIPDDINNLIHFQKRQQIYQFITRLQEFRQKQFNLLHVHQIESLLIKLPKITDKELDEISRKCE